MAGHNEAQSPEGRPATLVLQGPKGWITSGQSTYLENTNKPAIDLHCISDYKQLLVHEVNSSPCGVMGQEVAIYFQNDTTSPELIPSGLVREFLYPVPRTFFTVASPCKFMKVPVHRYSVKVSMCCWTWEGLLRRAGWLFLTLGVASP